MPAKHITCGPFETKSEQEALNYLAPRLDASWILLTNLQHSARPTRTPDDIDLLAVGPTGVHVIEIKHWDQSFLKQNPALVVDQAQKLNAKARRVKSHLDVDFFVAGKMLFTLGDIKFAQREPVEGIRFYSLKEWRDLLDIEKAPILDRFGIERVCMQLNPRTAIAISQDLRTFASYTNLELVSPREERFHRIYKGIHLTSRDKVVLHRYDLSAYDGKNPIEVAKREFEAIRRLQKLSCVPSIQDSFQSTPEFPGEIYFFSILDPSAPTIEQRAKDVSWDGRERVDFAIECARGLNEIHHSQEDFSAALLHRNLHPSCIRVKSTGVPLFTDLQFAQIPGTETVSSGWEVKNEFKPFVAPEILQSGLGAASVRSDVYSLCECLMTIFVGLQNAESRTVLGQLERGLTENPTNRIELDALIEGLVQIYEPPALAPEPRVKARYWDEDTVVDFHQKKYRVLSRLGSGGIGCTFKVIHVDATTGEEFGTYVGKVIFEREAGDKALRAYWKASNHTANPHLATLHETASAWDENSFVALLRWIEGQPLSDLCGVLPIYAEEQGEQNTEDLALRWLEQLSEALGGLHRVQLVHGDVSPKNIIVQEIDATLTDYDNVTESGKPSWAHGTLNYCSPNAQSRLPLSPSDDVYALAASFFHLLFDRFPFGNGEIQRKQRPIDWNGVQRDNYPRIAAFIERATSPIPGTGFSTAIEARQFILQLQSSPVVPEVVVPVVVSPPESASWSENEEPWLLNLLKSYPGSRYGNAETRGLDSEFAEQTYVETQLDEYLFERISQREVSLVILCGNAGDGKTAFLQHLAGKLRLPKTVSAQRYWKEELSGGLKLYANLDGSAAFGDNSASELLHEVFAPFETDTPPPNLLHLVAINSGPLLAWVEGQAVETHLTEHLRSALSGDLTGLPSWISFIDLNARSLVGGISGDRRVSTDFLDRLLKKMLGPGDAWSRCPRCTAQARCQAWSSVRALRHEGRGQLLRERLYDCLQAIHQRGEVHITARELRAAVSYIFFGADFCRDLHNDPALALAPYYDRVFESESADRQGQVLEELSKLDPGMEAHPILDRYLMTHVREIGEELAPRYPELPLPSARRRAYFEWTPEQVEKIGKSPFALGLARGKHLNLFRRIGVMSEEERKLVCKDLCDGISRLEDLPPPAHSEGSTVALKISPRTPIEGCLWVTKPLSRFRLAPVLPMPREPLETLHNAVELSYQHDSGPEESLIIGTELFHVLLELKDGFQLADTLSDDIFAQLSIFTQRLARDDDRVLRAWNPMNEGVVYDLRIIFEDDVQKLVLKRLEARR
jgi:serine/threonine protein kinase